MLRATRRVRRRQGFASAALALALCALPAFAAAQSSETGALQGRVALFHKKLFGKPERASEVRDVVVYLTGFTSAPSSAARASLVQQGEQFRPRLLPIVAGQSVEFPNRDRIYHNVFSVSPVNAFDLGQYKSSDPPKREEFARAGLVPVYCNIHPHMIAYVVVLENTAYALAAADGSYAIAGVPPGRHTLRSSPPRARARCARA